MIKSLYCNNVSKPVKNVLNPVEDVQRGYFSNCKHLKLNSLEHCYLFDMQENMVGEIGMALLIWCQHEKQDSAFRPVLTSTVRLWLYLLYKFYSLDGHAMH